MQSKYNSGERVFVTSDTHFSHANIIKYCNRPFASAKEMNKAMIENWNEVVWPSDDVYHLGDFSFAKTRGPREATSLVEQLNGNIHLLKGNHDHSKIMSHLRNAGVTVLPPYHQIKVGGRLVVLCHYPIYVWDKKHYDAVHLYGHCHGTMTAHIGRAIDVGVDSHNYTPISLQKAIELADARGPVPPADHHTEDTNQ